MAGIILTALVRLNGCFSSGIVAAAAAACCFVIFRPSSLLIFSFIIIILDCTDMRLECYGRILIMQTKMKCQYEWVHFIITIRAIKIQTSTQKEIGERIDYQWNLQFLFSGGNFLNDFQTCECYYR